MKLDSRDRRLHLNLAPVVEALTRRRFLAQAALAAMLPAALRAQAVTALRPYLQTVTPDSIWVGWRTDSGTESTVTYGTSPDALTNTVTGTNQVLGTNYNWHNTQLTGLTPSTYYYYKVKTGARSRRSIVFARCRRAAPIRGACASWSLATTRSKTSRAMRRWSRGRRRRLRRNTASRSRK